MIITARTFLSKFFPPQRGNALFLILIAVALFAGLSYAVTRSGQGEGSGPAAEENTIMAGQILDLAADLQSTADRMIAAGGASGENLYFFEANGDICSSGVNCFFAPDGGQYDPNVITVPLAAIDPVDIGYGPDVPLIFLYSRQDGALGFKGAGADNVADVFMQIAPIRNALCNAIDQRLGLGPAPVNSRAAYYTILPNGDPPGMQLQDTAALFSTSVPPASGCFISSTGASWGVFEQVLAAN